MAKRDTSVEKKSVGGAQGKPNILIIWGDDIGQSNLSCLHERCDGLSNAQHRPHRQRRDALHGLLRRAKLHGRTGGISSWDKACSAAGFRK